MTQLKPWRHVITPHKDVREGVYRNAEFAADLAQVVKGTAEDEYRDPTEFYRRTFLTDGMVRLLSTVLKRVNGTGGEPVVQLKTAFGGGKTHTMLALYHMFGAKDPSKLRDMEKVFKAAGIKDVPRVKFAVMVGTDLDATKGRVHENLMNTRVNTLWGELAAQIGGIEAYQEVVDADREGASPGRETLVALFKKHGPCIIMMDELVAYVRNFYKKDRKLAGGSLESLATFFHVLTEAVNDTRNCILVASLPESKLEVVGEGGEKALEMLEHIFARMETPWSPVGAEESFEIVRRRLFEEVQDPAALGATCKAFQKMYQPPKDRKEGGDFPIECREKSYVDRMERCYPIHPEVFDRLYQDWSSLERFQRTRGVLRLMAATIHKLWEQEDKSSLILPGNIPVAASELRNEFWRYIGDQWNAVVDADIDGPRSAAAQIDHNWPRIGEYAAARKMARAIFMASAPSVKEQRLRGVEKTRLFLATMSPEDSIGAFTDALTRLQDRCTYLYVGDQGRLWFDTRPSLRKTVEDRASQVEEHVVLEELRNRLKDKAGRGEFAGVHILPEKPSAVPDVDEVRLVILKPEHVHRDGGRRPAEEAGERILRSKDDGKDSRINRNMLLFLAPDRNLIQTVLQEIRRFRAWDSIVSDAKQLSLDMTQIEQAKQERDRSSANVDAYLREAYCWLFVPRQEEGTGPITWETEKVANVGRGIAEAASKVAVDKDHLVPIWSPALLDMEMKRWNLWQGSDKVGVKALWEYFARYPYLPRLKDRKVLEDVLARAVEAGDSVAYAEAAPEGELKGVKVQSRPVITWDASAVLVKTSALPVHKGQEPVSVEPAPPIKSGQATITSSPVSAQTGAASMRRFYAATTVDHIHAGKKLGDILDGIVAQLGAVSGAKVDLYIEVKAEAPMGFPADVQMRVNENKNHLKLDGAFEPR
jgi:predicted AAA+ superfamily ATPase